MKALMSTEELNERGSQVHARDPEAYELLERERHARAEADLAVERLTKEKQRAEEERAKLAAELDAYRKRHAELLGRMEADKGTRGDEHEQFLATFSHELRTPLNAILGWASLLRSNQLTDTSRSRALATIERNAMMLAKLVDDTLDVSRIVAGNLRVQCREIELTPLVEAARDSLRAAAEAKHVRIALELDPGAGAVFGDPDRLEQVAWNLLSNAIKFAPPRGKIDVRLDCPSSTHLRLRVRDNGKGIDPQYLPRLFERFTQADAGTRRSHGGLGVGLAIVKHVVELHGGTVTAESGGESTGATFTVLLPVSRREDAPTGYVPNDATRVLDGIRVLLVDDEPDARELLRAVLERDGAEVTTAASAREALAFVDTYRPHVLVSDIGMPEMDGYDLIRQVRALPGGAGGKLVAGALTAYGSERDSRQALEAGFQLHVPKPVTPSELVSMVARLDAMREDDGSSGVPPARGQ